MLKDFQINVSLLTGSVKQKIRKEILEDLKSGKINILIGTHALFQDKVEYNDLKYIVISYANICLKESILYRIVVNINKILTH